MTDVLLLLLGGLGLYFGAEWLIEGASGLARRLGMRPLTIGLTVVAYGTSAPELAVSCTAALTGNAELAVGNVIGSNIANIGLILGITALVAPPLVEASLSRLEVPILLLCALVTPLLLLDDVVSRLEGAALVACALGVTVWTLRTAKSQPDQLTKEAAEEGRLVPREPTGTMLLRTVGGLVVLLVGGKVFVDGAVGLATGFGIPQRVVGLTVVAVGTSLPELATSLLAARRGHSAIAVGNVVGSNIFNVLLILGATALVRPIEVAMSSIVFDAGVMLAISIVAAVFLRGDRRVTRGEGAVLVAGYACFIGVLVLRSRP